MKRMLLILSGVGLCFSACYKEKQALTAQEALVATAWKIDNHIYEPIEPGASCGVPQEVVFRADSTGYYYYPTPCDSGDYDTLSFRWTTSPGNHNLYLTHIGGNASAKATMGISYYDATHLRLRGNSYYKRYLSGYFIPKQQ